MAATPGDETEARMTLELGRRISALRKERGLTMVALAARTELSQPFLSQIERGRARPSMPSLHRLASALGTTTPALLSGGERGVGSAAEIDDDAVSLVRVDQGSMVTQSNGQAKALVAGEREMYPLEFVEPHPVPRVDASGIDSSKATRLFGWMPSRSWHDHLDAQGNPRAAERDQN
jgi:transcriptional regulator with XRE-family HTH domain